jgi:membrane protein required for beta-lactamase induction
MHALLAALALLIDRLTPGLDAPRARPYAVRYLALMREQFGALAAWGTLLPVLFFIAVPAAIATFLLYALHSTSPWLGAVADLIVVLLALGPVGALRLVEAYPRALERDDDASATVAARAVIGAEPLPVPVERSRAFARAVPQAVLERAAAPALWALLAGPIGALLWRLATELAQHWSEGSGDGGAGAGVGAQRAEARRVVAVLGWLPTRAFCLSLAAMGRSEEAFAEWRGFRVPEGSDLGAADAELLARVAHAALRIEPDEEDGGLHLAWSAVALAERAWLSWVATLLALACIAVLA